MIQESIYNQYQTGFIPPKDLGNDTKWFIFDKENLLIKTSNNKALIPTTDDINSLHTVSELYFGTLDGKPCFASQISPNYTLPDGMSFEKLRSLFAVLEDGIYLVAGRAFQLLNWHTEHRYCGKCGCPTDDKEDERAMICNDCGTVVYPTISPAIIVAVEKGNSILLAHSTHFTSDMYSVIAGFVEPGETLEDCVRREVMEEVGIKVKNIKYFASQAWPYPNSLMVGFTAEYEGGNLAIDHFEIDDAGWYTVDNLPKLPNPISISSSLIKQFLVKHNYGGQYGC